MSRKLLAFLLSELATVRIDCPKCKAVIELTVEQMSFRLGDPRCPVCRDDWPGFVGGENKNLLTNLGKAIHELQLAAGAKRVEFIIPDTQ